MKFWIKIIKRSNSLGILLFLSFLITIFGLLSPIFIIHIFNRYITFGLEGTLFFLVVGALIVAILEYIFRNLRHNYCSSIISQPIKSLKLNVVKIFFNKQGLTNVDKNKEFLDAIDINNNLIKTLNSQNQSNILDFFFAALIIIILFFINKILASIFFLIFIFSLLYQKRSNDKKNELISLERKKNANANSFIPEFIYRGDLLRILNAFKYSTYNFSKYLDNELSKNYALSNIVNYENSMHHFLLIVNSIIVIGIGSIFVVNGDLTIGSLIGFNIFASRALQISINSQKSYFIIKNVDSYFNINNNLLKSIENKSSNMELNQILGEISLKNLNFNYNKENTSVLNNLNIIFPKESLTVISGSNGSGKSTLCKLILGLINPISGDINIDGTSLRKLSHFWWRDKVSYIPQNTRCLNISITDNIQLSNPELNNNEIGRLIKTVKLDNIMKKTNLDFQKNLDSTYSMGIHKKIHYARLLARDSKIIILDDPMESLDNEGKEFVQNLLISFKKTKKTIICFCNDNEISNLSDYRYNLDD